MRVGTLKGTDVTHLRVVLMHLAHGTSTALIIPGHAVDEEFQGHHTNQAY
jgi:hypothetical protein